MIVQLWGTDRRGKLSYTYVKPILSKRCYNDFEILNVNLHMPKSIEIQHRTNARRFLLSVDT